MPIIVAIELFSEFYLQDLTFKKIFFTYMQEKQVNICDYLRFCDKRKKRNVIAVLGNRYKKFLLSGRTVDIPPGGHISLFFLSLSLLYFFFSFFLSRRGPLVT